MTGQIYKSKEGGYSIKITPKDRIVCRAKRFESNANPLGLATKRFELDARTGVYKSKCKKWYKVIASKNYDEFEAIEIDIQHVYDLLVHYNKLDFLNPAINRKYSPVNDWLRGKKNE